MRRKGAGVTDERRASGARVGSLFLFQYFFCRCVCQQQTIQRKGRQSNKKKELKCWKAAKAMEADVDGKKSISVL